MRDVKADVMSLGRRYADRLNIEAAGLDRCSFLLGVLIGSYVTIPGANDGSRHDRERLIQAVLDMDPGALRALAFGLRDMPLDDTGRN